METSPRNCCMKTSAYNNSKYLLKTLPHLNWLSQRTNYTYFCDLPRLLNSCIVEHVASLESVVVYQPSIQIVNFEDCDFSLDRISPGRSPPVNRVLASSYNNQLNSVSPSRGSCTFLPDVEESADCKPMTLRRQPVEAQMMDKTYESGNLIAGKESDITGSQRDNRSVTDVQSLVSYCQATTTIVGGRGMIDRVGITQVCAIVNTEKGKYFIESETKKPRGRRRIASRSPKKAKRAELVPFKTLPRLTTANDGKSGKHRKETVNIVEGIPPEMENYSFHLAHFIKCSPYSKTPKIKSSKIQRSDSTEQPLIMLVENSSLKKKSKHSKCKVVSTKAVKDCGRKGGAVGAMEEDFEEDEEEETADVHPVVCTSIRKGDVGSHQSTKYFTTLRCVHGKKCLKGITSIGDGCSEAIASGEVPRRCKPPRHPTARRLQRQQHQVASDESQVYFAEAISHNHCLGKSTKSLTQRRSQTIRTILKNSPYPLELAKASETSCNNASTPNIIIVHSALNAKDCNKFIQANNSNQRESKEDERCTTGDLNESEGRQTVTISSDGVDKIPSERTDERTSERKENVSLSKTSTCRKSLPHLKAEKKRTSPQANLSFSSITLLPPPHYRYRRDNFVDRHTHYKECWKRNPAPGENVHLPVRKQIRDMMKAAKGPPPPSRPKFEVNRYVVPTSKSRMPLRWEVRRALAEYRIPPPTLPPSKFGYTVDQNVFPQECWCVLEGFPKHSFTDTAVYPYKRKE